MVPKVLLGFLLFGAAMALSWPSTAQCNTFCTQYQLNCSNTYDIYNWTAPSANPNSCQLECSRWPMTTTCATPGSGCAQAATENSYDCRLYHLTVAGSAPQPSNNDIHCQHATPLSTDTLGISAPNGGQCLDAPLNATEDTPKTGLIQDLCNNLVATCGTYFGAAGLTMQWCYNAMYYIPGINDVTGYPYDTSPFPVVAPTGADSFICRRYHVQAAGTPPSSNVATHCPHAFTGVGVCGQSCDFYCDIMQNVCSEFASTADCMTACNGYKSWDFTQALPTTGNNVGCRIYHATAAAQGPDYAAIHCAHAGMASVPEYCGSGATLSASLLLVAVLAFFSLN